VNVYLDKEYPGEYEDNRHLTFPGEKSKNPEIFPGKGVQGLQGDWGVPGVRTI
jgi:hypothetical protein